MAAHAAITIFFRIELMHILFCRSLPMLALARPTLSRGADILIEICQCGRDLESLDYRECSGIIAPSPSFVPLSSIES
jgi:hypothetical protein